MLRKYIVPYSIVAAGALAYFVTVADAATLRIGTKDYQVSAQTVARIRAFAEANYKCLPPTTDNECPPNPNPMQSMYDAIRDGLMNNVRAWEAQEALKAVPAPPALD